MNRNRTIFLLIPLVLVILAVVISTFDTEKKTDERIVMADFNAEEVKSIEFNTVEDSWKLVNDGNFVIEGSRKTDETAVNMLLGDLLHFDGKRIEKQGDKAIYGLDTPLSSVTYTENNGNQTTFYVGDKTPPGTEYYISDENGRVYSVYTETGRALSSQKYQVEDSFILGMEYESLTSIEVLGDNGFKLLKGKDSWKFVYGSNEKTIPVDIIRQKVTRHFGGMYSLKAMNATDDNKKRYGLDEIKEVVILNGIDEKNVIYLGDIVDDKAYIMVENHDEIYCVIKGYFEFIKLFREEVY